MTFNTIIDVYGFYAEMFDSSDCPHRSISDLRDAIHDSGLRYEEITVEWLKNLVEKDSSRWHLETSSHNILAGVRNLMEGSFEYLWLKVRKHADLLWIATPIGAGEETRYPWTSHASMPIVIDPLAKGEGPEYEIYRVKTAIIDLYKKASKDYDDKRAREMTAIVDMHETYDDDGRIFISGEHKGYTIEIRHEDYVWDFDCPIDRYEDDPTIYRSDRSSWVAFMGYQKNTISSISRIYAGVSEELAIRYLNILGGVAVSFRSEGEALIASYSCDQVAKIFGGDRDMAMLSLEAQVGQFKAWNDGDVFHWVVKKDDEFVDSCHGYYGTENHPYMIEEAIDAINADIKRVEEERLMWNREIEGEYEAETGLSWK